MKLTESQLRRIIKQELKKVLFENVENVQALIASFDELQYVYDQYDTSKILKFNKGQNVGELTESEIEAIADHIGYDTLDGYDIVAKAEIIGEALKKKVSQYKHSEEEHLALRKAAAEREKKKREDRRRANEEYFKKHNIEI